MEAQRVTELPVSRIEATGQASPADGLIGFGVAFVSLAVLGLAGGWWGLLALGGQMLGLGVFRAVRE